MKHFTNTAISEGKGYIHSDWVFSMTLRDHPESILIKCSSEQTKGIRHQKEKVIDTTPIHHRSPSRRKYNTYTKSGEAQ